ncbi:MAG: hypothetical protein QM627_05870 [Luteolibacter sp.]
MTSHRFSEDRDKVSTSITSPLPIVGSMLEDACRICFFVQPASDIMKTVPITNP